MTDKKKKPKCPPGTRLLKRPVKEIYYSNSKGGYYTKIRYCTKPRKTKKSPKYPPGTRI